ncbi:uncharacterized protein AMSG_01687 [Thecamonas trahens ATCC 50062]|uniref:N-acetyltransferase domain-containing protein n=1 Tax=Thecamonas trahens ATCC 50062 TaxID=461836 RepID=A0A0L0DRC2_THETB|nr:hypothetical protein AMSG_01687 [Thecamonas trahens ATCC 50062]KNC54835.1 hypothetical protein AMSG_01687 [Thecamonas trahens ATCC 50062]|eukprot:XP_013761732.1 hypothetical protein AMSG_01687 [Thecamonas trahens ATCC 50062]
MAASMSTVAKRGMKTMGEAFAAFGEGVGVRIGGEGEGVCCEAPGLVGAVVTQIDNADFFSSAVWPDPSRPLPQRGSESESGCEPALIWIWAPSQEAEIECGVIAVGRIELVEYAMPCMALDLHKAGALAGLEAWTSDDVKVTRPSMAEVGTLCATAYDDPAFEAVLAAMPAETAATAFGVVREGAFVSVMVTVAHDGDVGIYCMATAAEWRRRGLARAMLASVLVEAAGAGAETASLQSSPDGAGLYSSLGFVDAGVARCFARA